MQALQEKLQTQRKDRRKFARANPLIPKTIACFVERSTVARRSRTGI
ncbi:hypothetical protein [Pseudorhodoplanes sinuspersici]|nr:hypothetical protein [Pseudorhodoplanes sinuspersici]